MTNRVRKARSGVQMPKLHVVILEAGNDACGDKFVILQDDEGRVAKMDPSIMEGGKVEAHRFERAMTHGSQHGIAFYFYSALT